MWWRVGSGVAAVLLMLLVIHELRSTPASSAQPSGLAHVTLASVASLSSPSGPLPVTGKVASLRQATILSQTSGELVSVPHALGDTVSAGGVIAQFENASQQAAVTAAQGAYDAALASLAKAQGATAANSGISSSQAAAAAGNAATAALAALGSAYAALDDAVHAKADPLFNNPHSAAPTLLPFTIPDGQLVVDVQNRRAALDAVIDRARVAASATTTADIDARIDTVAANAVTVQAFLDDLIAAVNQAVPNQNISAATIASDQAALASARTEVVAAAASLASTKTSFDAAQAGAQTAANSASSGTDSDIALAKANVQQALGGLQSAQAALSKTVVRSPLSGVIVSLPVRQGDYVSQFSTIAEVSNPNALEVETAVTAADAKTLAVGAGALIDGSIPGVITAIAPAIDPATGQIQVKVGITGDRSALTDGDTVGLSLDRAASAPTTAAAATSTTFTIPITAAKITPQGPIVFTVSSSTLVAQPVVLGTILGDQVRVVSGLSAGMDIVTDARGLSAGQTIAVTQ